MQPSDWESLEEELSTVLESYGLSDFISTERQATRWVKALKQSASFKDNEGSEEYDEDMFG